MRKRFALIVAVAALLAAAAPPAPAQTAGGVVLIPGVNSLPASGSQGFGRGFGFRHEQFPVFGWGFDAHHFSVINQTPGFFGGGFFGRRFFAGGFFPFASAVSSSTVVVVPQVVPVQVPVPVVAQTILIDPAGEVIVPVGLPENWGQVRVVKPSVTAEQPPLPQLTLVVLKDGTIYAVTDYWLEDGRLFYVTSTGKQDAVAVRDLDLELTTRLNAERHVPFILRSR